MRFSAVVSRLSILGSTFAFCVVAFAFGAVAGVTVFAPFAFVVKSFIFNNLRT